MKTKRVLLRPWRESDAEILYEYAKDPIIGRNCGWPPHTDLEESRRTIREVLSAPENYAIILRETGIPVGSIALKIPNAYCLGVEPNSMEMGFWIGVPYWGQGLIGEAANLLIDRAFRELKLSAVWCGYYSGNERSKRAQEKIGFHPHHCEKMAVNTLGEYVDTYYSCITIQDRISDYLFDHADEKYKVFSLQLIPGIDAENLIGVRIPDLRKLEKRLGPCSAFMHNLPHKTHEENLLHAMMLCQISDIDVCIAEIDRFLPYVDNWAVCDTLSPKCFANGGGKLYRYAKQSILSDAVYTIRFGYGILMRHFSKQEFQKSHLELINNTRIDHYYIRMGIAWYLAEVMIEHFEDVCTFFEEQCRDREVIKLAIQKGIESFRVLEDQKAYLKIMRKQYK